MTAIVCIYLAHLKLESIIAVLEVINTTVKITRQKACAHLVASENLEIAQQLFTAGLEPAASASQLFPAAPNCLPFSQHVYLHLHRCVIQSPAWYKGHQGAGVLCRLCCWCTMML